MRHNTSAGRPTHTREPTHRQHKGEEDTSIYGNRRGVGNKTHAHHHRSGDNKTHNQELTSVRAVREATHQKLTEGVGDGDTCHSKTSSLLIQKTISDHIGRCQREVLTNQIVGCITKEGTQKYLQTHTAILAVNLISRHTRFRRRRIKKFEHNVNYFSFCVNFAVWIFYSGKRKFRPETKVVLFQNTGKFFRLFYYLYTQNKREKR